MARKAHSLVPRKPRPTFSLYNQKKFMWKHTQFSNIQHFGDGQTLKAISFSIINPICAHATTAVRVSFLFLYSCTFEYCFSIACMNYIFQKTSCAVNHRDWAFFSFISMMTNSKVHRSFTSCLRRRKELMMTCLQL